MEKERKVEVYSASDEVARSTQVIAPELSTRKTALLLSAFSPLHLLHLTQCETMSATYNPDATLDDATWVAVLLVSSSYHF
jgi:hypothetical protein